MPLIKRLVFILLLGTLTSYGQKSIKNWPPEIKSDTSYVYKKINDLYSDSYSQNGFNFGSTYDFSFLPIRIDYVFYSKLIKMNLHKIHNVKFSDHKPISVFFNI